jgi:hypothetical protein
MVAGCAVLCGGEGPDRSLPPVLRNMDPEPDVIVRLPGRPPAPVTATVAKPDAATVPAPEAPEIPAPNPPEAARPVLRTVYPPSFVADSAAFCQDLIGQWTEADARLLFGEPLRRRPAYDDNGAPNGSILAFSDPTHRYREIELDFNDGDGTLRTVFAYPQNLTWQEARRKWGSRVNETAANKGRRFYSYVDRRLDVLVDSTGHVISFGLY